jgi:alpha-tubulin suppressor-like RCC1 family protein
MYTVSRIVPSVKDGVAVYLTLSVLASICHALVPQISSVSVGLGHTCAVNSSGNAFCWGYNYYGQVFPRLCFACLRSITS